MSDMQRSDSAEIVGVLWLIAALLEHSKWWAFAWTVMCSISLIRAVILSVKSK